MEAERVEKDRMIEVISRERETELQRIEKEKAVEVEKKAIADVIRERVAVDKTVAEQEEQINELRVVEEANRLRKATVIAAEGQAQEALVKDIKAAEAQEEAAKFKARERLILADAEVEAADKEAQAKIRLAEGVQAEQAAEGLAQVKVREQDAAAVEKQGRAEALVTRERGTAEAAAIREKLSAEAGGIEEKARAMAALDEASRGHEEYRLRLDKEKEVQLEAIDAQRTVAEAQASVLAQALKDARIDIVGGEGVFLDKLTNAIAMGRSIDGFVDRSETLQTLLADYLQGEASLPAEALKALQGVASSDQAGNVALGALVAQSLRSAKTDKTDASDEVPTPPRPTPPSPTRDQS